MWQKFDRITIAVPNLDAAKQHMVCMLGRTPSWSGTQPQDGTENVVFRLDNTDIELLAPSTEGRANESLIQQLAERGDHIESLALETDDAEAAAETLRARGVPIDSPMIRLCQDGPSGAFRRSKQFAIPPHAAKGLQLLGVEQLSLPEEIPPSSPIVSPQSTCCAIDHIVVLTQDPERAKQFYGMTLGIRLALDHSFEERNARILFFRLGGLTLEIGASNREPSEAAESEEDQWWGLAYQVDDIDLAHERMRAEGIEVSEIRKGFKPGTRVFTLKDEVIRLPTLVIEPAPRPDR